MPDVNFIKSSRLLGRLIFGFCVFASAIMVRYEWTAVMLFLATIAVLRLMSGTWEPCRNAWRVLRWLLVPIVLLHLVFTPGTYIVPQIGGPSYEAVYLAAWLSLRLSLVFLAAMVFSRMLTVEEWAKLFLSIPHVGPYMYPYLRLLFPMRVSLGRIVQSYRQQWRMRRQRISIDDLAKLLSGLFDQVWNWSERQGMVLWLRWGEQEQRGFDPVVDAGGWLLILIGGAWLLAAAML